MKLRDAIEETTNWCVAIHVAYQRHSIDWLDAMTKMNQIRDHARCLIGHDLLEIEL